MSFVSDDFSNQNLIPKEGDFDGTYKSYIPSPKEQKMMTNRNRECMYSYEGITQCRRNVIKQSGDPTDPGHKYGFYPCKVLVDSYYRCMTENHYGNQLKDAPEYAQPNADKFVECAFQDLQNMMVCQKYIHAVVRDIYRSPDNKLVDHY